MPIEQDNIVKDDYTEEIQRPENPQWALTPEVEKILEHAIPPKGDNPNQVHYLPPGGGEFAVSNIQEVIAIINFGTRVFKNPDVAVRQSRDDSRAMLLDLQVLEPLRTRQLSTAELPWEIQAEDKKDKEQIKIVRELTRIIEEIPDWLQLRFFLMQATWWGRAGVQLQYKWDFHEGKKRLVINKWWPVHGDVLTFGWDGDVGLLINSSQLSGEGLRAITSRPTDIARAHFLSDWERETFLIHKHEVQAADFFDPDYVGSIHGVGLRSYIYWTWFLKRHAHEWLTNYLQRVGLGITVWYFEQSNPASLAAVQKAAAAQTNDHQILFPRPVGSEKMGSGVERIEPTGAGLENFLRVIDEFYGGLIRRMIAGSNLGISVSRAAGNRNSPAISGQDTDVFAKIVRFDAQNLEDTLNRDLIKVLMKWNFPDCPATIKLKLNVDKPDPDKFMQAAREFYNLGGDLDGDELREVLGLSKPTKDSLVLKRVQVTNAGFGAGPNPNGENQFGEPGDSEENEPNEQNTKLTKTEAVTKALDALGQEASVPAIREWLMGNGLEVSYSTIYNTARSIRGRKYQKEEEDGKLQPR